MVKLESIDYMKAGNEKRDKSRIYFGAYPFLNDAIQNCVCSIALNVSARPGFVALRKVRARFTCGGNILSSRFFQDILRF